MVASECDERDGYHYAAENSAVEILNDGEVVYDKSGEMIVTDLNNFAMPFIRYSVGDVASLRNESYQCPCGVNLPMLTSIAGRISDFIKHPDGRVFHPISIMYLFYTDPSNYDSTQIPGIIHLQVVQSRIDRIELNLVTNDDFNQPHADMIRRNFELLLGTDIGFEINIVDEIAVPKSGKRRFIISEV